MRFFIDNPGVALLIGAAALVAAAFVALRRRTPFIGHWPFTAALAWLLYGVWEVGVVDSGDAIRVDLVLIYPALLVVSFLAVVQLLAGWRHMNATKAAASIPPPSGEPLA